MTLVDGLVCPLPLRDHDRVQLGHGSGGKMSADLLRTHFLPRFANAHLSTLADAATVPVEAGDIAFSTDTFVVDPLEFPGGNIGLLAVHGTLNDVAMMGADPLYLSVGFVLEEGLEMAVLERVLDSMAAAASATGVPVVTGDTKVVERGKADCMFINTTAIGRLHASFRPTPNAARPGDLVLVSGPIGRHGISIMAVREGLGFETEVESDTANLVPLVQGLREEVGAGVHVLRDPTRGGVASALNEIASSSGVGVVLRDGACPVPSAVRAACEMLGLDPLYVANEGILVAIVASDAAEAALEVMTSLPVGEGAAIVGEVTRDHPGMVLLETGLGGRRVVDMLPGDQLPRIC